ncbi:thiamine pyrophosphokinase [Rhodofomes roseus]|uniref:Thiamine pyrophosphokinase n=1 Tax=Rhodofomes roseus TaxID=34475 RepID=A0ABQ8KJV1_9APHY|nr:thiamine pyrophosphokinase [Rhodofomes roseus]KAH9838419.1 thiamine pyrophosphokinase [Rhodofomes roseus]
MADVSWSLPFFDPSPHLAVDRRYALIILNQPFSFPLLRRLWNACSWRCCADGGGNRLHDLLKDIQEGDGQRDQRSLYRPNLIKGDLDSLRDDVREYYASHGVPVVHDPDQYATDLMKCIRALEEKDTAEGTQSDLILIGGLSGRLDQTVHTLSLLHKLRKGRMRIFAVTDDNLAWVLDEVRSITLALKPPFPASTSASMPNTHSTIPPSQGTHHITVNHAVFGPTCGLLPVGVDSTVLTTTGLRWNLTDAESSFGGLVSTSNHLVPEQKTVTITTSKPIWWTMELRPEGLR